MNGAYDEVGNQTSVTYPDSTVVTKQYDLLRQLTGVTDADGEQTAYSYDPRGNLTAEFKCDMGASEESQTTLYTYDALNRLTSAKQPPSYRDTPTGERTYQYDSLGNLVYEQTKGK